MLKHRVKIKFNKNILINSDPLIIIRLTTKQIINGEVQLSENHVDIKKNQFRIIVIVPFVIVLYVSHLFRVVYNTTKT